MKTWSGTGGRRTRRAEGVVLRGGAVRQARTRYGHPAAIRYAQRGFPASQYLVDIIHQSGEDLAMFPASADVFLPGGSPRPWETPSSGQTTLARWRLSRGTGRT